MTAEEFCRRLSQDCHVAPGSHVLAAVSGGADSVALLCFLLQVRDIYPLSVSCVHVEHGIRGEASRADLAFVRALCAKKNIPLYTANVDAPSYARAHGCGLEDAARVLRHEFLRRTAEEEGADVIALAHHAGDQAETVLLHAIRGSDIRGLCAMRMRRGRLIRPLLACRAQELREYLISIGQDWREDESNTDLRYARNRIRRSALPELEAASPGAGAALCRLSLAAQRDEDYFERQLDALDIQTIGLIDGIAVEKAQLAALHPALFSRMLVRLMERAGLVRQNAGVIEAIMELLARDEAAVNLSGGAHAVIGRRYLCLTRADAPEIDIPLAVPGMTDTPFGRFEVRAAGLGETGDGKYAQRMPRQLLEGVCVTNRREGDMIIPFGKHSPARLKKLMIEAGIERAMRASVPILRKNQDVIFAIGLRPSERCRCTENGDNEREEQMIVRFLGAWPGHDEKPNTIRRNET